jgi:pyrimidine-nucleoside phosphorylase
MIPHRVIDKKRRGIPLSEEELRGFLDGYLSGEVGDHQMAAFLMAIHFRGLDGDELSVLLDSMVRSGATLAWPDSGPPVVDKHSTGGVGDKVSLVLAPLAAELGLRVPMMSGRGLGHTTGTLDKLESIPGFRTDLPLDRFREVVDTVGVGMIGQTAEIAPLDRRLYDLRSVTATVPSIPLIAASIMSKKLAEGLSGLVLDVKMGPASFLPDPSEVRELAALMVALGTTHGVRTTALLTAMDRPLGQAIGNGLEAREALECLHGEGPEDLRELVLEEVTEMMVVGGVIRDAAPARQEARARAEEALDSDRALQRFRRLVEAQGGDPGAVDDPERIPLAPTRETLTAPRGGWVQALDVRGLGEGVVDLGGGRTRLGQEIDLGVGFKVYVRPGQEVEEGSPLGEVFARTPGDLQIGIRRLTEAVPVGDEPPSEHLPLVIDRIS